MKKLNFGRKFQGNRRQNERGQTTIFVVIALSLFLLGFTGLAVDYSNLWFHRQAAQGAADAACQAGAMDMYLLAQGTAPGGTFVPGFTPVTGASSNCSSNAGATPCEYATLNGYSGAGLVASSQSNQVTFSFPATVPGVTPPPVTLAPVPFMRVDVTDRVRTYLAPLITGNKTQDVLATAKCGLVLAKAPIPLILLHPTKKDSLSMNGTPDIRILGGPAKSIQVNSDGVNFTDYAVGFAGTNRIDLTQGGPNYDGSSLGTYGLPHSKPSQFYTAGTGSWQQPSSPIPDPYYQLPVPDPATLPVRGSPTGVGYLTHGCPDLAGCDEYDHGYYPSGITVALRTAIFIPGVYYVNGSMKFGPLSQVRPSTQPGDGSGGTVFYLTGPTQNCSGQTGLICTGSNSGSRAVDPFDTSGLTCTGGIPPATQLLLPATLDGNVLLAPCSGTYGGDSLGHSHGILFFGDRDSNGGGGWGGQGAYALAGTIYIHQCSSTDGADLGTHCAAPNTGYNATFHLQGGSGSTSYVLGQIITDSLGLGGNSVIKMALNPDATSDILKVALLQ